MSLRLGKLPESEKANNCLSTNKGFEHWLLGPCDPKWRFPTVCMIGFVFGLKKIVCTYLYRPAG